jgi:hypothetical protein
MNFVSIVNIEVFNHVSVIPLQNRQTWLFATVEDTREITTMVAQHLWESVLDTEDVGTCST